MEFGALMFFTDYAIPATEFAQALEARGFESVWAPDIRTSRPRANRRGRAVASCPRSTTRRWIRSCR